MVIGPSRPSKSPIPGEPTRAHVRTAARALAGEYRQRLDLSGRNGLELALGAEQVRWLTKVYVYGVASSTLVLWKRRDC